LLSRDRPNCHIYRAQSNSIARLTPSYSNAGTDWPPKNTGNGFQGYSKAKLGDPSRHNSYTQEDDVSWDPELDKDDGFLSVPRIEKKRYAREEQRTILAKNLSDRVTHKDITDFVRGGLILDIYLRSNDRSASISFLEGSAAHDFMNYAKRNDIYVHGKRVGLIKYQARWTRADRVAA